MTSVVPISTNQCRPVNICSLLFSTNPTGSCMDLGIRPGFFFSPSIFPGSAVAFCLLCLDMGWCLVFVLGHFWTPQAIPHLCTSFIAVIKSGVLWQKNPVDLSSAFLFSCTPLLCK